MKVNYEYEIGDSIIWVFKFLKGSISEYYT